MALVTTKRILFVCHGNICRSPMAELIMKELVKREGRQDEFLIDSAATRENKVGFPIHKPAADKLLENGIDPSGKVARLIKKEDYDIYDYIVIMDEENKEDLKKLFGDDRENKIHKLLSFTGSERDVSDPWYTKDFDKAYEDIYKGCTAMLGQLLRE